MMKEVFMTVEEVIGKIVNHCNTSIVHHGKSLRKFEAEDDGSTVAAERIGFQKGRLLVYHEIKGLALELEEQTFDVE